MMRVIGLGQMQAYGASRALRGHLDPGVQRRFEMAAVDRHTAQTHTQARVRRRSVWAVGARIRKQPSE